MRLLEELHRRRVFRALAWYGGAAWLAIQAASILQPQLALPPWTVRAVIVALLVGIPVVGLLSWAFDLEREGGSRPTVGLDARPWRAPSLWFAVAAGLLLTFGAYNAWRVGTAPGPVNPVATAVLPFENLSGREEDLGLVNGLQASIRSELGANPGLSVISRIVSAEAGAAPLSAIDLARRLGARYLLEGGVRRDSDSVSLHVRLIDGRSGQQAWYADYRRPLAETFVMQRELARELARAVAIAAAPENTQATAKVTNAEAVELYLQAKALDGQRGRGDRAINFLTEATRIDPSFALGWAFLAEEHADYIDESGSDPYQDDRLEVHLPLAKAALARAEALDSNLLHAADARMHIASIEGNAEAALAAGLRMETLRPGDAGVASHVAWAYENLGRWDEAVAVLDRATTLDPLHGYNLRLLGRALQAMGRYAEARPVLTRAADLGTPGVQARLAWGELCGHGEYGKLLDLERSRGPDGLLGLAHVHLGLGNLDQAREAINQWLEAERTRRGGTLSDHELNSLVADVWDAMGRKDDAARVRRALLRAASERVESGMRPDLRDWHRLEVAAMQIGLGDYPAARATLGTLSIRAANDTAVRRGPNLYRAYGLHLLRIGDIEAGVSVLRRGFATPSGTLYHCPRAAWLHPFLRDLHEDHRVRALFAKFGVDVTRRIH